MKILAIILVPAVLLLVFGGSFNYQNIATRFLEYLEFIGERIGSISLTNGYEFNGGFKEASLALVYVVSLPLRVIWAIFQVIYHTFTYWGVSI